MKNSLAKRIEKAQWTPLIKMRAKNKCELCGRGKPQISQLHAHHIERKTSHFMRLSLDNGICLCGGCHMSIHGQNGLGKQDEARERLDKVRGKKFIEDLKQLKFTAPKLSKSELEDRRKHYKNLIKKHEGFNQ